MHLKRLWEHISIPNDLPIQRSVTIHANSISLHYSSQPNETITHVADIRLYVPTYVLGLLHQNDDDKRSTATTMFQFANIFALCTMHQRSTGVCVCFFFLKNSLSVGRCVGHVVTIPFTVLENLHAIINIRLDRIESHVGEPLWQMQKSFANDRHIFSIANIFQLLLKWLVVDGQVIGGNNYKWTTYVVDMALWTTALWLFNQIFVNSFFVVLNVRVQSGHSQL